MNKLGPLAILLIIALVVLVALGGYLWLTFSRYFHGSGMQSYKILSTNQTGQLGPVLQNMTQGFSTTQFEVTYSGNAVANFGGLQLTFPLRLSLARYFNDSLARVDISGVPLIGNLSMVQIRNGSSYYSCTSGINSSKTEYQCSAEPASNSVFSLSGLLLNNSQGQGLGSTEVHFGTANQSSYNGMACTNINGYFGYANASELNSLNITAQAGQQFSTANVLFLACVSTQYRIPLTMVAQLIARQGSSNTTAGLQLYENSFRTTSSAGITALPGPLKARTG